MSRWNRNHTPQLDAARLLTLEPADGVIRYKQVHENTISGNAPYGQLAIEYEIERLSIVYGPQLLGICASTLESDVLDGLSFFGTTLNLTCYIQNSTRHSSAGCWRNTRHSSEDWSLPVRALWTPTAASWVTVLRWRMP